MRRSPFRRRSKFGAIKTKVDGVMFDSRLESQWYVYLKILGTAGQIKDLELQKEFVLAVAGKQICIYIADYFFYDLKLGKSVVGDAKGVKTDVFKLKWKLMQALYPEHHYQIYTGKPK
jgi:hypothetical protein